MGTMDANVTIRSRSEDETIKLGTAIGRTLRPGDVVCLMGDLGAGKTRMAKGIVSASTGVDPREVVSPTFTLLNLFEGPFPVYHVDLYRIESDQISDLGLEDSLGEPGAIVLEWGEKDQHLEGERLCVTITHGHEETTRIIALEWRTEGTWETRMKGVLGEWAL